MTILSKVCLVLVIIASLPMFYLTARALKIHTAYKFEADRLQKSAEKQAKENLLKEGRFVDSENIGLNKKEDGIIQLTSKLNNLVSKRGRLWDELAPAQGGNVAAGEVNIVAPQEHGIQVGTILWIFNKKENLGYPISEYLGRFRVTASNPESVTVTMLRTANDAAYASQIKRLTGALIGAEKVWHAFDAAPLHYPGLYSFINLDGTVPNDKDDRIAAKFPDQDIRDRFSDDQPLAPLVDADGNATVTLDSAEVRANAPTDFEVEFDDLEERTILLLDDSVALAQDIKAIERASADSEKDIAFRVAEIANLKAELEQVELERDKIKVYLDTVQAKAEALQARVNETFSKNKALAQQITDLSNKAFEKDKANQNTTGGPALETTTAQVNNR